MRPEHVGCAPGAVNTIGRSYFTPPNSKMQTQLLGVLFDIATVNRTEFIRLY